MKKITVGQYAVSLQYSAVTQVVCGHCKYTARAGAFIYAGASSENRTGIKCPACDTMTLLNIVPPPASYMRRVADARER